MAGEPHLRPVREEPDGAGQPAPPAAQRASGGTPRWVPIALGVALAVTLLLLVWSRVELGQRVAGLEDQVRGLEAAVEERERVISAHRGRLETVRQRVGELQTLLDEPLPSFE